MVELPTGTVTFLFTDLERSTGLWEDHPEEMKTALARHDEILRGAVETHHGHVVKTTGDGVHAVFASAHEALEACLDAQRALGREQWPERIGPLRVRMGVHAGEAELRDGDYYGPALNRAARLMAAGHGGQVLVSEIVEPLVRDALPADATLVDLGAHRLRDLADAMRVFQLAHPDLPGEFGPLRSVDSLPGNLPFETSSFVGREHDVTEITQLLRESRLVTLTGVGGVGKTRLALQVARDVLSRFREGAWLVELASVRDPDAVADAVAAALGALSRPAVPMLETLTEFVRPKQLLLVLDNCEHLLGPTAELVRTLEHTCPGLVVLATSREGLGISGERIVSVPSLLARESEQLFVERATAARAGFELTGANARDVADVCRRLDGIPLAIELAAARVAILSPAQLAQRLDQRFRILAGGERGAIERHATLRAAIDWSYDLLTPQEQLMLARLSVFAGGCTLDAAEAVCVGAPIEPHDVLDLLSGLVMRSLVIADTSDPAETYYRLLETIRQYAEERLTPDDRDATCDRHARYFAEWVPAAVAGSLGPDQAQWFRRTDRETENLRAAMNWALERRDTATAVELLSRGTLGLPDSPEHRALLDSADAVLALVRATDPDHLTLVLAHAALLAAFRGERDRAHQLCAEARSHADGPDDDDLYDVWAADNWLALASGDIARALACMERIAAWCRRNDYENVLANMTASLVMFRAQAGDITVGIDDVREALKLCRRTGAPTSIATAQAMLAWMLVESDPDAAHANVIEAMEWHDTLGSKYANEPALLMIAIVGARLGDDRLALRAVARILRQTPSSTLFLCSALEAVAAAVAAESPHDAATLHGAVDTLTPGLVLWGPYASIRARTAETIATQLDPDTIDRDHQHGAAMTESEATDLARALADQARAKNHE